MLRLFRINNGVTAFIILLIYALLLRSSIWVVNTDTQLTIADTGILSNAISSVIDPYSWLGQLLATLLVVTQGVILSHISNTYRISDFSNYYAAAFYVLMMSLWPAFLPLSDVLIANTFLIFTFDQVVRLYQMSKTRATLFNIGMWIGIASLFSWGYIVFALWAIIAIGVLRAVRLSELLVVFIGIVTPWWLLGTFQFWNSRLPSLWTEGVVSHMGWDALILPPAAEWQQWLLFATFALICLLVLTATIRVFYKQKIQNQKIISVTYWGLLCSTGVALLAYPLSLAYLTAAFPFIAFILGIYTMRLPFGGQESLHWSLIFTLLLLHYGGIYF